VNALDLFERVVALCLVPHFSHAAKKSAVDSSNHYLPVHSGSRVKGSLVLPRFLGQQGFDLLGALRQRLDLATRVL
jgi:hypothetical protein